MMGITDASTSNEEPDEVLFSRLAAGDATSFAAFYDRHAPLWFALALRIVQSEAEAEDVLQEAAVTLWERAPLYDPDQGRPVSWAIAVVRNKAIDRVRAGRRRTGLHGRATADLVEESTRGRGPDEVGFGPEAGRLVRQGMAGLPPEQREAIELAYFEGLTQSEIAGRLGQPLGTIKARIRRGMLAMRDALEGAL